MTMRQCMPRHFVLRVRAWWNFCSSRHVAREAKSPKHLRGTKMTTRAAKSAAAEEIAAIEDLMSDLEKRLRRLSGTARRERSGASSAVRDFVGEALERIMNRARESASDVT